MPKNHLPIETCKLIEFVKSSLISKNYKVFIGPIQDQNGKTVVSDGEVLQREQILNMDWLVEGIVGNLPDMKEFRSFYDLSTGRII